MMKIFFVVLLLISLGVFFLWRLFRKRAFSYALNDKTGVFESGLLVNLHLRSQKIHAHNVAQVWFSDDPNYPTYGNGVIMEYETDSLDALVKYAFVHALNGCVFDIQKVVKA